MEDEETLIHDDLTEQAQLVTCQRCQQPVYMTHPQPTCIRCRTEPPPD